MPCALAPLACIFVGGRVKFIEARPRAEADIPAMIRGGVTASRSNMHAAHWIGGACQCIAGLTGSAMMPAVAYVRAACEPHHQEKQYSEPKERNQTAHSDLV